MPRAIDPIILNKYENARKKGNGKGKSLKIAGYAKSTSEHMQNNLKLVKIGERNISNEFKASNITADYIMQGLETLKKLCIKGKKKDLSSAVRIFELYGRYLKLWSDNIQNNILVISSEDKQKRLSRLKALINNAKINEAAKPNEDKVEKGSQ